MKHLLMLSLFALALEMPMPVYAQTAITASGPSQCYGFAYPINCSTTVVLSGGVNSYRMNFMVRDSTFQTLNFADLTNTYYMTVTSFSQHIPTGAVFPDTVTFKFQGEIDGDLVNGTVTIDLTYTPHHINCGGRGNNCTRYTVNVTVVNGSLVDSN